MQRGGASLGDKTLLDALVPAVDTLEAAMLRPEAARDGWVKAVQEAADEATQAAHGTRTMLARRGRAAYTGERSIGSPDAGAVAVSVILQRISQAWGAEHRAVPRED